MADRIVYGQKDLEKALCEGLKAITLCAGIYDIPLAPGVRFDRLGPVKASVRATRREAESAYMLFWDIYPEYRSEYAIDSRVPLWQTLPPGSEGSFAGLGGSGWSSLNMGSSFTFGSGSCFGMSSSFCGAASFIFGYGIDLI